MASPPVFALSGYIASHHSPSHTRQQLALATEQLLVATKAGDKERVVDAHEERLLALVELGDVHGARTELSAMTRLATERRRGDASMSIATILYLPI